MKCLKILLTIFIIISTFLMSGRKQKESDNKPNEAAAVQEANQVFEAN